MIYIDIILNLPSACSLTKITHQAWTSIVVSSLAQGASVPCRNQIPRASLLCALLSLHYKQPLLMALAQSPLLTEAAFWWHCLPAPDIALPEVLHFSYSTKISPNFCYPESFFGLKGWVQSEASFLALPARFKKNQVWSVVYKHCLNTRFPNDLFFHVRDRLLPCPTHNTDLIQPFLQCGAA